MLATGQASWRGTKGYSVPDFFKPMSTFQMGIGSGYGIGVPPENHPSSWFTAVKG